MRKAQELSLNMIVVGALALLVLLIIGGVLIFGGGDMLSGLTSLGPSQGEVDTTAFLSTCRSKCNTLNLQVTAAAYQAVTDWTSAAGVNIKNQVKAFCCSGTDLDGDALLEVGTAAANGAEICSIAYDSCKIGNMAPNVFCKKMAGTTAIFNYLETSGTDTTKCTQ